MQQKGLFDKVQKEVELLLYKQLAEYVEIKVDGKISKKELVRRYDELANVSEIIMLIGREIRNISDTTVQYLMRLTNDYIRSKCQNDKQGIRNDRALFEKWGFDARSLDVIIDKMDFVFYDMDNLSGPNKLQEQVLQQVFDYFGCPGKLPTVEDIREITSKFGIDYIDDKQSLPIFSFRTLDYNFDVAMAKGLSIEQIVMLRWQLDEMMALYLAPRKSRTFKYCSNKVTEVVLGVRSEQDELLLELSSLRIYRELYYELLAEREREKQQKKVKEKKRKSGCGK